MSIAKVEPLTTARALRGPFDYRLPERLADVAVGSVLLVPFGRRRVLGVVVELAERSSLPPERLAEPIAALEAGAPPELVRLGLWVAREYCSTPARGLELVLPPGTGSARGQTRALTETARRGDAARPMRRCARAGWGPCSGGRSSCWSPTAPSCARPSSPSRASAATRCAGSRRVGCCGSPSASGAAARERSRSARRRPGSSSTPTSAPRSTGSSPRSTRTGRAAAARSHRLGQDRGLPRGRRGGARAGTGRDRDGARDRDDAAGAGPLHGPLRTAGGAASLAARRRRAPRRVDAAALGRGADLRRPALGGVRADGGTRA